MFVMIATRDTTMTADIITLLRNPPEELVECVALAIRNEDIGDYPDAHGYIAGSIKLSKAALSALADYLEEHGR